jgi:heme/copper-type cytochrome/quinol oxidase subunit 2
MPTRPSTREPPSARPCWWCGDQLAKVELLRVVAVGPTVRVKLVSAEVVHGFYVPQALCKRQAIPGPVIVSVQYQP